MTERRKIEGAKWSGNRKGIECPHCHRRASHVYRTVNGSERIFRERQCIGCGEIWQTIEVIKASSEDK